MPTVQFFDRSKEKATDLRSMVRKTSCIAMMAMADSNTSAKSQVNLFNTRKSAVAPRSAILTMTVIWMLSLVIRMGRWNC